MAEEKQFPIWDATKANKSLVLMHRRAANKARERIDWYKGTLLWIEGCPEKGDKDERRRSPC